MTPVQILQDIYDDRPRAVATALFMLCRRPFNSTHSVPAAIHCLSRLLRERSVRILFQRVSGSVQLLAPLLRSNASAAAPNQQLLYEAGMCVWQLTFYEPAAQAMGSSGVVQGLVDMARSATKEKVTLHARLKEKTRQVYVFGCHIWAPLYPKATWGSAYACICLARGVGSSRT